MSKLPSNLNNLIPAYILEQYPNFVLFLKGYYEWLTSGNRPNEVISKHLDRLSFKESLDEYTNHLKNQYLPTIPSDMMANKELLIKWSKNFYRSKGSFYSYEFLFRTLFNSSVDLYLPKNDIFRLSDGKWIANESVIFVTVDPGVADDAFLYKKIKQVRQIYPGVYEYAYASVQRINIRSFGGYNLTELYVSNVKGEFKQGAIENDDGDRGWLLPISSTTTILAPGQNFQPDDVLYGDVPDQYQMDYVVETDGVVDTHINTFFSLQDLEILKNGNPFVPTSYDGRNIAGDLVVADEVSIKFPTYKGLITVNEVSGNQIKKVSILDPIIGNFDALTLTHSNAGTAAGISIGFDVISKKDGYWLNNDSQLSADRYLQDSRYYQEYSYVLRTEVDIDRYRNIVLQTVHPAGMKLFGIVSIADLLSMLISIVEDTIQALPNVKTYLAKYAIGPNLSMVDRLKATLDSAVWRVGAVDEHPVKFWIGDPGYKLHGYEMVIKNLFKDAERAAVSEIGWMTSHGFADQDIGISYVFGYVKDGYVDADYVVTDPTRGYEDTGYLVSRYHYS